MPRLVITIDVSHVDPATVDAAFVADEILDTEFPPFRSGAFWTLEDNSVYLEGFFVSAEWMT